MTSKDVLFRAEAREKILRGATALADAVRVTLGPRSKCVLIEKKWGRPLVCNDGVTIAKEIELKDSDENLGAGMLSKVLPRDAIPFRGIPNTFYNLKRGVAMNATKPMTMHSEHKYWESETSLWRDDLRLWQQELAKAQGEIKQLEKAFEQHAHALRIHASTLRLDEEAFEGHEHALVEYEKGGEGEELFQMARQHSEEAVRHAQHRAAHEQLKRRHHTTIAHWNLLLKSIQEPIEGTPSRALNAIVGSS